MSYNPKTDWVDEDIVLPADMNRIEQGIADTENNTWKKLSTKTLDGTALAIPTGYKHLKVVIEDILITSSITQGVYFNSDTTDGNYSYIYRGTGDSSDSSAPYIAVGQYANTDNFYGIIDIINNTDKLKFVNFTCHQDNGQGFIGNGIYKITTEISSMNMTQFNSGRATLYGMK